MVFFKEYVDWLGSAGHILGFTLVSNQPSGVCSYSRGFLSYQPSSSTSGPFGIIIPATLENTNCQQLFNDRSTSTGQPFNTEKSDSLAIRITLSSPPRVRLTLNTWGGALLAFTPECSNGILIGAASGVTFVVSLQKGVNPK